VTIYRLAVAGTIEQGILGLHKDKRQMAAELLDGSEASAKLSDEELIGLLRG
jgi:SNF2 family DNA or RNA helicase